jgi:hypothetical protein
MSQKKLLRSDAINFQKKGPALRGVTAEKVKSGLKWEVFVKKFTDVSDNTINSYVNGAKECPEAFIFLFMNFFHFDSVRSLCSTDPTYLTPNSPPLPFEIIRAQWAEQVKYWREHPPVVEPTPVADKQRDLLLTEQVNELTTKVKTLEAEVKRLVDLGVDLRTRKNTALSAYDGLWELHEDHLNTMIKANKYELEHLEKAWNEHQARKRVKKEEPVAPPQHQSV